MNNTIISLTMGLVGGIAAHTLIVNIPKGVGDSGKIGMAVINPDPSLTEVYIENQDGNGHRLGNMTLGLDSQGNSFIGGSGDFSIINTDSAFPHPALFMVKKNGEVVMPKK